MRWLWGLGRTRPGTGGAGRSLRRLPLGLLPGDLSSLGSLSLSCLLSNLLFLIFRFLLFIFILGLVGLPSRGRGRAPSPRSLRRRGGGGRPNTGALSGWVASSSSSCPGPGSASSSPVAPPTNTHRQTIAINPEPRPHGRHARTIAKFSLPLSLPHTAALPRTSAGALTGPKDAPPQQGHVVHCESLKSLPRVPELPGRSTASSYRRRPDPRRLTPQEPGSRPRSKIPPGAQSVSRNETVVATPLRCRADE